MNSLLRHCALVLGVGLAVFACSSSEKADTVDAAASCGLHDGVCGEGCCSQPGNRYDSARDCVEREQVIGCAAKPASTSECVMRGIVGCIVRPEGTFRMPGLVPGWTGGIAGCDDALREKVMSAKACPTTDAGGD